MVVLQCFRVIDVITNNDYEKSVLIGAFVKEVRDRAAEREHITDISFTPVIGGYEISFLNSGINVRVTTEVKGFFVKKLIIKKYVGGKMTASYKAHSKEEISFCTEQILTE